MNQFEKEVGNVYTLERWLLTSFSKYYSEEEVIKQTIATRTTPIPISDNNLKFCPECISTGFHCLTNYIISYYDTLLRKTVILRNNVSLFFCLIINYSLPKRKAKRLRLIVA
jgi:hypothetical protein